MATTNKVTKLYPALGNTLTEQAIQQHMDQQNIDGWSLIQVDHMSGWYRFFWSKVV